MRSYVPYISIILALLVILGTLAHSFLEVYPRSRLIRPSPEARLNPYLALERWLVRTGHPVRIVRGGGVRPVRESPEAVIVIQDPDFDWASFTEPESWIGAGKALVIALDNFDRGAADFLAPLGVEFAPASEDPEAGGEEADAAAPEDAAFPRLDNRAAFSPRSGAAARRDAAGAIRLLSLPLGKGSLTVTGEPYFMWSFRLKDEANARLAWELTGGQDAGNQGVLFIRPSETEADLLDELSRRGPTAPLLISILVLTALGFWMVIPVFGVIKADGDSAARSIRERFLAEARFLKKYQALGGYLDWYIREIRARLRRREGRFEEGEFIPRLRKICGGDLPLEELLHHRMHHRMHHRKKIGYTDFVKYLKTAEAILERL
jgi:hypothetical protein